MHCYCYHDKILDLKCNAITSGNHSGSVGLKAVWITLSLVESLFQIVNKCARIQPQNFTDTNKLHYIQAPDAALNLGHVGLVPAHLLGELLLAQPCLGSGLL